MSCDIGLAMVSTGVYRVGVCVFVDEHCDVTTTKKSTLIC